MKKWLLFVSAPVIVVALGAVFAPAQSVPDAYVWTCSTQYAPSQTDQFGEVCAGGDEDFTGWIYVDGGDGNPDPADGYISASNNDALDEEGLCASTEGDPEEEYDEQGRPIEDDEETPSCNEDLWREAPGAGN